MTDDEARLLAAKKAAEHVIEGLSQLVRELARMAAHEFVAHVNATPTDTPAPPSPSVKTHDLQWTPPLRGRAETHERPSSTFTLNDVQVAARLGVTPFAVRQWRRKGEGPRFMKMGRAVRYKQTDVAEYEERIKSAAAPRKLSCVYLFQAGAYLRIGMSNQPKGRLPVRYRQGECLGMLIVDDDARPLEKALHREFAAYRFQGELFQHHPSIIDRFTSDPRFALQYPTD